MRDLTRWHRWFAWRPVKTPDGWRWLCFVERRLVFWYAGWWYEYLSSTNR